LLAWWWLLVLRLYLFDVMYPSGNGAGYVIPFLQGRNLAFSAA
jgi:hypothetical protein